MKKELTEEQRQKRRETRLKFNRALTNKYKVGMSVETKLGAKGTIENIIVDSRFDKPYFILQMEDGKTRVAAGRHMRKYWIVEKQ